MYCLVDYYQCQEWLPGSRCKAQLEKRDPVECFTEQNGLIVRSDSILNGLHGFSKIGRNQKMKNKPFPGGVR